MFVLLTDSYDMKLVSVFSNIWVYKGNMLFTYNGVYNLVLKKNIVLLVVGKWMELSSIVLSKLRDIER